MINKEILINKIVNAIKEEQEYMKQSNEIDRKHYKMRIDINKIIEISDTLKKEEITEENINQKIIVSHNGNPYITYILAIKAICNDFKMSICVNQGMLATNCIIIKIINEVLKEMKINNQIEIINILKIEELKNDLNVRIIILQDKAEYSKLLKAKVKNINYNPMFNISLFAENEELEGLKQDIIKYCFENFIEIEIYEAENLEELLEQIEADNEGETVIILTKENVELEKIQRLKNDKNIEININKNILKDIEKKFIKQKLI